MSAPSSKYPSGRFMATVRVGEKGQIVIPKGARDLFGIRPGDTLLLLADVDRGIAIVRNDLLHGFAEKVLPRQDDSPEESPRKEAPSEETPRKEEEE
ncbi:MAG: AbrB/MazE/SpoVT family DNA-binding domain-containing protein [Clostridia bacterium]|nr:AbrB/MazE/SpoVT family DNA-binding domain-containing protein [Clostridia bacterium]